MNVLWQSERRIDMAAQPQPFYPNELNNALDRIKRV